MAKVAIGDDGCWLWKAGITGGGYGYYWHDGGMRRAHKYAFEFINGSVADGLDLDHLCRIRSCVNPDHLEPVTRSVNSTRGEGTRLKNTCRSARHEIFTDADLYIAPDGGRECRRCKRERRDMVKRAKSAGVATYVISRA